MNNRNIKKMILFLLLLTMLIGIASATNTQNNTNTDDTCIEETHNTITKNPTQTKEAINDITANHKENNKTVSKITKENKTVKEDATITTRITYKNITPVTLGNTLKITGNLLNGKKGITGQNVTISVDNLQYTVKTGKNGTFSTSFTPTNNDKYYVSFTYLGNVKYLPSRNSTSFYVKKTTNIDLNHLDTVSYGENIYVSGHLLAGVKGVNNARLNITIGNRTYTRFTSSTGYFKVNYIVKTYDKQKITISYGGNNYFKATKTTQTLITKKLPTINLYKIKTTKYDEYTKISGKLLTNSTGLKNQPINIIIGDDRYTTITSNTGYFLINHKTKKVGTNNVRISYDGNTYHEPRVNTTKFNVTKQNTKIILNKIANIKYGNKVTVTGKLLDRNNKTLANTKLKLGLNGVMEYVQTNTNGIFEYSKKTNKIGTNTISACFAENTNYLASEKDTTFKVVNKTTILKFSVNNVTYNDYTNITGYLVDKDYKNLINTRLIINLNGKTYYTVTDYEGDFIFPFYAKKTGINRVSVTFNGTELYSKSSITKVFKVVKKETYLYIDSITTPILGDTVKITGEIYDDDYEPLKFKSLVIKINNDRYTIKTNSYGAFTYKYKTKKYGKHDVSVSFAGDTNYKKSNDYTDFIVEKAYTITLSTPRYGDSSKSVGTDTFSAWYIPYDAQSSAGVYLDIYYKYATDMGQIGTYMLLEARFYFKNNKGKVISRVCKDGGANRMWHEMIPGYTPYKVVAKYRKLTAYEKRLWEKGYDWDPLAKEWVYPSYYE
ncbi:MAG: hypothetical protein BZ138_08220 [Methanosphaera sp. rholeuAM270]|nr:MAG: hypothetical protein BZ138_08220 [Methanosphaera sp. rholeuAM270]